MPPSAFSAHVRRQLPPLGLDPLREAEIVEELAQQMEQTYEAARAEGVDHGGAERAAHAIVADWRRLADDFVAAERSLAARTARRLAASLIEEPDGAGRGGRLVREAWQDARHGARWLARHPAFTAAALLTLSLTIGASSAIFSLVNAVLLAPLPFPDDDRLMVVAEAAPAIGFPAMPFSPLDYLDYAAGQRSFAALGGYRNVNVELAGEGDSERIDIVKVQPSIFEVLGVSPQLGRAFGAEDARPGVNTAILSHALWTRRFAAEPAVIGRTVLLDRQPFEIVGVMPATAAFPLVGPRNNSEPGDVLVPLVFSPSELEARARYYGISVLGRLAPGATLDGARSEAATLVGTAWSQYPIEVQAVFRGTTIEWVVIPYHDAVSGRSRLLVLVLFATVLLLLLAGCANLGSLLLALTTSRQRELAVRASLGAGRLRLARQLMIESLVLAALGGALGLGVAWALVRVAPTVLPATLPRLDRVGVDTGVLLFTIAAALVTAALFGVAPAWRWSRVAPSEALATGASRGATGAGAARVRRGLAVAQCAFAVLLLVPAALLGRTLFTLLARTPGFDTTRTLTASTYLPAGAYGLDGQRVRQFYEDARARLEALPGVGLVGLSMDAPMAPLERRGFVIEGREGAATPPIAIYSWITPGYLEALGVPLVAGRGLDDRDGRAGDPVVLVSQTAARLFWPGEDPLGKRVRANLDGPWHIVAGVVGDVSDDGLDSDPLAHLYAPLAGVEAEALGENVVGLFRRPNVVVSATAPVTVVGGLVRETLRGLDPQLALTPPARLRDGVVSSLSTQRLAAAVVGAFSVAALAIAAVGLHGVLAFGVAQRRRELGIRLALGATPARVGRQVAGDGAWLVAAGLVVGLFAAYAASGLIRGLLVGVSPADPATFAMVAAVVVAVALAAVWAPARSATRIDPAATIREV
jgi:putative ABC transport system permease protein